MKHLLWSNNDGNDSFEVEGNTFEEVLINALSELGWSISEKPIEEDEDEFPESECMMEARSKRVPSLVYLVKGQMTDSNFVSGDYKVLFYITGEKNFSKKFHKNGAFLKNEYTFKISNETF